MSNPTIRRNDQGQAVKSLQQQLSQLGYPLVADGLFGAVTEQAVKKFQKKEGLWADGVVGPKTWAKINARINQHPQAFDPIVDQYLDLGPGEYIHSSSKKIGVCLHHTVSGGRPERVVEVWKADRRGPVGTHFVIGRGGASGNAESDGKIVQCIPIDAWAHHILSKRMGFSNEHNILVNQSYIGIELCSWGILEKKNGRYYALGGKIEVPANEVAILPQPFRTYKYWHKYSPAQLDALYRLLVVLGQKLHINYGQDGPMNDWFELSWEAMALRRKLCTHTNFEYGKFDTFPQAELINVLQKVYRLFK